ncbi:MAG: translation initiation factor IF-2, partial [Parasphingorhabdus sp.]
EDKKKLLGYLKGDRPAEEAKAKNRITLKRKTTSEIKQTSKTGAARTVHVEVRKKRTFVKRADLQKEADQEAAREREAREKLQAEEAAKQTAIEEAAAAAEQTAADVVSTDAVVATVEEAQVAEPQAPEAISNAGSEQALPTPLVADDSTVESVVVVEPVAKLIETAESTTTVKEPPVAPVVEKAAEEKVVAATPAAPAKPAADADARGDKGRKKKKFKKEKGGQLHVVPGANRRKSRGSGRGGSARAPAGGGKHGFEKPTAPVIREVSIPETITVGELAVAMSVKAAEVIKKMMEMGTMVTINQVLDQDTATILVEEMGHTSKASTSGDPEALLEEINREGGEVFRAPVVTVMGHVDHGKTSLLDRIRETKVAAGEAGGITQHIGAYKVATKYGDITFLDTPGHEAFSAMRARGAQSTDLVILVVAGDDGVKPQTIEAIHHSRQAGVAMIVAVNKMDKEGSDVDRVKQELTTHEVVPEDWGGDVQICPVSAHTGEGVEELLEAVSLQAEVMELKANPNGPAVGVVVEARLDRGRGPVATLLIREGSLVKGDALIAGRESGRVRALNDFAGRPIKVAGPSDPIEIQGLSGVPVAGDEVLVLSDERKAREIALFRQGKFKEVKLARQQKTKLESMFTQMEEGEVRSLNLVIKTDVQGSVEALTDSLEKLSRDDIRVKVVHGLVGGINESDVNLAMASEAIIVGFNVRADATARKLIDSEGIDVHYYNVIYDVVDEVKAAMTGMLRPVVREKAVGLVQVRDVFRVAKIGAVAGCYVLEGIVKRNLPVRILRDNVVIFDGQIDSLRRFKEDVAEVRTGFECGIGVKNYNDIKAGDQIEVYELVEERIVV